MLGCEVKEKLRITKYARGRNIPSPSLAAHIAIGNSRHAILGNHLDIESIN